ncbi:hypothetical protein Q8A73_014061 [Channa argus]|nr:hypothetical protein Q8A73_014061 [Channa argus]
MWRASVPPWLARNNEAASNNRGFSPGLLRHLMNSRWLLADSPLHFCAVCYASPSSQEDGAGQGNRQVGTAMPPYVPLEVKSNTRWRDIREICGTVEDEETEGRIDETR